MIKNITSQKKYIIKEYIKNIMKNIKPPIGGIFFREFFYMIRCIKYI